MANPALGDFLYVDALRSTMRTTREADFRRYRLGQWTQHADAWLPREAWLACAEARSIPEGADEVLGFDGSYSGDATAIVAVEITGGSHFVDVVRLWEHRGVPVPIVDVEDALREACKKWWVKSIVADPFRCALPAAPDGRGATGGGVPAITGADDTGDATVRRSGAQPSAHPLR